MKWINSTDDNCMVAAVGNIFILFDIPFDIKDIHNDIDYVSNYGSNYCNSLMPFVKHMTIVGHGWFCSQPLTNRFKRRLTYHLSKQDRAIFLIGQYRKSNLAHAFMMYNDGNINIINNDVAHEKIDKKEIVRYLLKIYLRIYYIVVKKLEKRG